MPKKKIPVAQSKVADYFDSSHPHLKGFVHVLQSLDHESARGMVLILTGFLEESLKRLLEAFFRDGIKTDELFDGSGSALGTFSARIRLSQALGLISDKEHTDLHTIRGIRNDFAHEPAATFDADSIKGRTRSLGGDEIDGQTPRLHFQLAAVTIIISILRRVNYFRRNRRMPLDPNFETKMEDAPEGLPPDAVQISTGGDAG